MVLYRPAQALGTFLTLLLSVVIVVACGAMLESGLRYREDARRYAAAPIVVATTQRTVVYGSNVDTVPLPELGRTNVSLVRRIESVPGVRAAIPDESVPLYVWPALLFATPAPTPIRSASGHPWSAAALTPFRLVSGHPPGAADQVVLDEALARATESAIGGSVQIGLPDGPHPFRVSGIARSSGSMPEDHSVFFSDQTASILSGHPGSVYAIGVFADPGIRVRTLEAAVQAALPAHRGNRAGAFPCVYTGMSRGQAESAEGNDARAFVIATSATFGGLALLVAVFVIAGTVGLSVRQRSRDIALLRAVAMTPREVRRMIVVETLLLSMVAGTAGVSAGVIALPFVRDQLIARGLVPGSFVLRFSWIPLVVAVAATALTAGGSAWIAGRPISRRSPVEGLLEAVVEKRRALTSVLRTLVGVALLIGAVALVRVAAGLTASAAAGTAIGIVLTFVLAVALLAPLICTGVAAASGPLLRRLGVPGRLAAANVAASSQRVAPVLTSLVLAISLGGSLWFLDNSIQHAATSQSRSGLRADQIITTKGPGMPQALSIAAAKSPGVLAATGVMQSTLLDGEGSSYTAEGVDPTALRGMFNLGVVSGTLSDLVGPRLVIDTVTADDLQLRVGSEFHGSFADGTTANLRVVAIYRRGLGFAAFTLSTNALRPHTDRLDDLVLVADRKGADRTAVAHELAHIANELSPGASIQTAGRYQSVRGTSVAQNDWTLHALVSVLLVYVSIAAANNLVTAAISRRRELAALRSVGTTRGQILRMICIELTVLLMASVLIGGAIAVATLIPLVKGTTGSSDLYIPRSGLMTGTILVVLLGLGATLLPVYGLMRIQPGVALDVGE